MGTNERDVNNSTCAYERELGANDNYEIPAINCKDDDHVKPFVNVDPTKNHEYESPSEVAKSANLHRKVSGHRRKNNQLYGQTTDQRVRFSERPNAEPQKCDIKLAIFSILALCLSVGGLALGLMNMLYKEDCSCSSRGNGITQFWYWRNSLLVIYNASHWLTFQITKITQSEKKYKKVSTRSYFLSAICLKVYVLDTRTLKGSEVLPY